MVLSMGWRIIQALIIVAVTGTLLGRRLTPNALAAGIVGAAVAFGVTVMGGWLRSVPARLAGRGRRSSRLVPGMIVSRRARYLSGPRRFLR